MQPAEHRWPLTNASLANRRFASPADLDAALADRGLARGDQPETISAHTQFHRWPAAA